MFRVLRGLTKTPPGYLSKSSEMYHALVHSAGHMVSLGMDLSRTAAQSHGTDRIPLYILIVLVVGSSFWQSRQMTARNPGAAAANPQAQMMTRIFPLFSGLISFNLPAGVVLYFLVSNMVRIGQQSLMYRLDPTLAATVKKEVKEIDAKADEIERTHKGVQSAPPAPSQPRGPVARGGNGASTNGGRPNSRKQRKRRQRKR
jgi:YidC/Oxa1 family membrane protein insertase